MASLIGKALAWLGQLATSVLGTLIGLWIGHRVGLWPA